MQRQQRKRVLSFLSVFQVPGKATEPRRRVTGDPGEVLAYWRQLVDLGFLCRRHLSGIRVGKEFLSDQFHISHTETVGI